MSAIAYLCSVCYLVRKGIGLPQCQLLIVEGVAKYTAHHRNVLEEEKQATKFRPKLKEVAKAQK